MPARHAAILALVALLPACQRADIHEELPNTVAYSPPIEVTTVRSLGAETTFAWGDSIHDNVWTRYIQEKLGIRVRTEWTDGDEQTVRRLNLLIASDKLPDFFSATAEQVRLMAEAGQLAELGSLVEKDGSELSKSRIASLEGGIESATFGGRLMAIPAGLSVRDYAPMLWIRADWLRSLNLAEPKTIADVLKIAQAFAEEDPDGNGKNDTYGLALQNDLLGTRFGTLDGFFNGYGAFPFLWVEAEDGRAAYGSLLPGMRDALLRLQTMYREGWIDPDFALKDVEGAWEQAAGGRFGMAYGPMWSALNPLAQAREEDGEADWRAYPIVGENGPAYAQAPASAVLNYYVASKNAAHPEALVRMLNLYAGLDDPDLPEDVYKKLSYEGVLEIWKYFPFNGFVNPGKNLETYLAMAEMDRDADGTTLTMEQKIVYEHIQADRAGGSPADWAYARIFGENGSMAVIDGYLRGGRLKVGRKVEHGDPADADRLLLFRQLERETYVKIIQGAPIGTFDELQARWESLGLGDRASLIPKKDE